MQRANHRVPCGGAAVNGGVLERKGTTVILHKTDIYYLTCGGTVKGWVLDKNGTTVCPAHMDYPFREEPPCALRRQIWTALQRDGPIHLGLRPTRAPCVRVTRAMHTVRCAMHNTVGNGSVDIPIHPAPYGQSLLQL